MRVAAQAEPVRRRRRARRRTARRRPASLTRWAASSAVWPNADAPAVSTLIAKASTRSAVAGCAARRELRRRLGPTAAAGRRRVGDRDHPDGPVGCCREVGDRPGPRRVGVDPVDDAGVLVEHALPRRDARRHDRSRASPASATTTASTGPDSRATAASAPRPASNRGRGLRDGRRTRRRGTSSAVVIAAPAASVRRPRQRRAPACAAALAARRRLVEDRAEPGVAAAVLACGPRPARARWGRLSSTCGQRADVGGAHHLEEPGRDHHATSAPAKITCPRHPTRSPRRRGGRRSARAARAADASSDRDTPPVADRARSGSRRPPGEERPGHHPGHGDRRHGVDRHPARRNLAELPGERGDGPLGAAVRAGVGGPPPRARGDAEDPAVPGGGHDRQRGARGR